jgi:hypothetical protein
VVGLGHQEFFFLKKVKGPCYQRWRVPRGQERRLIAKGLAKASVPRCNFFQRPLLQKPSVIAMALVAEDLAVAHQVAVVGGFKCFVAPGTVHRIIPHKFLQLNKFYLPILI